MSAHICSKSGLPMEFWEMGPCAACHAEAAAVAPPSAPPADDVVAGQWIDALQRLADDAAAERLAVSPPETTAPTATCEKCGGTGTVIVPGVAGVFNTRPMSCSCRIPASAVLTMTNSVSPVASSATPTPPTAEQSVLSLVRRAKEAAADAQQFDDAVLLRIIERWMQRASTTEPRDAMAQSIKSQIEGSNVEPR